MLTPTAANIRTWTPRVQWQQLGYPAGAGSTDTLAMETALAVQYIEWVTERKLDATMPPELELIAQKAVALRVIQQANYDGEESVETMTAGEGLASFNVTGYSETYVDQGARTKTQREAMMVNPSPELNRLLWALMTPARMAWWRGFLSNGGIPAYGFVEMDWSGQNRWGGWSEIGGGGLAGELPGYSGASDGGWDTWAPTGSNTSFVLP